MLLANVQVSNGILKDLKAKTTSKRGKMIEHTTMTRMRGDITAAEMNLLGYQRKVTALRGKKKMLQQEIDDVKEELNATKSDMNNAK